MRPADVRALVSGRLGSRLFFYPETDSTNDLAAAAGRDGEPEGSVFYTDFQRRGRGRRGRRWVSGRGNDLLFSVVLRPEGDLRRVLPVTLVASIAFSVALSRATGHEVGVKWPNDLMARRRKLGGILAESRADGAGGRFAVVGVGINVNGDFDNGLGDTAVSCRELAGASLDRAALFADLLTTLDTYYARFRADGFGVFVSSYEERMVHAGARVRFEYDGATVTAKTAGLDADGALRVIPDGGDGEIALYNETLELLP